MAKINELKKSSESAHKPASVIDHVNLDKLGESKNCKGFGNASKNINDINTTYSHSVIDLYANML